MISACETSALMFKNIEQNRATNNPIFNLDFMGSKVHLFIGI